MVRGLWKHRELIAQLTRREITQRYQGTYLGVFWSFLNPFLMLLIYTFVFSVVFQAKWGDVNRPTDIGQFALTLFAGLIPFNVFSEVVTRAPSLILQVPNYVKRVVFPLEVLVVVALGSALVHSLISVGILLVGIVLCMGFLAPTAVFLPLIYLPLILLCLGLGWFLSSLGVYVRDIGHTVIIAVQMLFFMTPIFYPLTAVPAPFRFVMYLNPLMTVVDSFRRMLLRQQSLSWPLFVAWTTVTAVLAVLGYVWFMKTKSGFADVM
jgi:lipopolysaccharide transport system permease protein